MASVVTQVIHIVLLKIH